MTLPHDLRWIFLDAGNTLVHLDFERVAGILREDFALAADVAAMEAAEPGARLHVDGTPIVPGEPGNRWHEYFWAILSAGGWPDRARIGDAIGALFRQNKTFTLWSKPAREALSTLVRLKDMGYRLAVISNSDGSVEAMLERLGLAVHLDFVIDSHLVGMEKPDRRIFDIALEKSGAVPAQSLYVGDMFHIDVIGSRSAGMHAALIDPAGNHGHRGCLCVSELAELPGLIERRKP